MTQLLTPEPAASPLFTRVAVALSIAVHVAAVGVSLGYAGAGLFGSSEAEAVSVTMVTAEQVAALAPEPTMPETKPEADKLNLPSPKNELGTTSQKLQPPPAPQASSASASAPQSPPGLAQPQTAQPVFTPAQPDISLRYQVDLGLKPLAAAPPPSQAAQGSQASQGSSDFDAPASSRADIDTTSIGAFRAQLKQCSPLPAAVTADDHVMIVLRARFTPDGRLAAAPILIEASASAKGPALMQAAIGALQSCQPFTSLPADKYTEWRVLDLRFTPQDFRKG